MKKADAQRQWEAWSELEQRITRNMYEIEDEVSMQDSFGPREHGPKGARWAPYAASQTGATFGLRVLELGLNRLSSEKLDPRACLRRLRPTFAKLSKAGLLETQRASFGHHFGGRRILWARLTTDGRAVVRAGGQIPPKQRNGLKKGQWFLLQRLCELGERDLNMYPPTYAVHQLIRMGLAEERQPKKGDKDARRYASPASYLRVTEAGRAKYEDVREELEELWGKARGVGDQPSSSSVC